MNNKLIAILCTILILSLPFTYAQVDPGRRAPVPDLGPRVQGEGGFGGSGDIVEDILIEVSSYEPAVLVSSLLEENNNPVYANLVGTRTNPFIEVPKIRNIAIRPTDIDRDIVRGITWVRPGGTALIEGGFERSTITYATLEDLGYLIILLNKIEKEKKVPKSIDVDLEATITYDLGAGTGLNEQDLTLSETTEKEWLGNQAEQNKGAFLGQSRSLVNGYLRVNKVGSDGSNLAVYRSDLQKIADVALKVGEISGVYSLYGSSGGTDAFRIRLNDVREPRDKIKVNIDVNGNLDKKLLGKGQAIYPGSLWKVKTFFSEGDKDILEIQHDKTKEILRFSRVLFKVGEENAASPKVDDPFAKARDFRLASNYDSAIAEYNRLIKDSPDIKIKEEASIGLNRVKALIEFEKVLNNFAGINFPNDTKEAKADFVEAGLRGRKAGAEALIQIAKIYEEFGTAADIEKAIASYGRLASEYKEGERSLDNIAIEGKLKELALKKGSNYEGEAFFEENNRIALSVLGFELLKDIIGPYAEFLLGEGREKVRIGLAREIFDNKKYNVGAFYNWKLDTVDTESVLLARPCKNANEAGCKDNVVSKTLKLNKAESLMINEKNPQRIELVATEINKEAYITVLPGLAHGISKTNFSLHIPVEDRAMKFSDDTIDKLIDKTQKQIEKLNGIIESLSEVVETWKKICLATFAFVTVKNFFEGLNGRSIARTQSMNNYWKPFCQDKVNKREFETLDACYSKYSDKIGEDTGTYQAAIEEVNKLEIQKNNKFDSLSSISGAEYSQIKAYESKTNVELVTQENVRDLNLYNNLLKSGKLSAEQSTDIEAKRKALLDKINNDNKIAEKTLGQYNTWLDSINTDENKRSLAWKDFRENYGDASFERVKVSFLETAWHINDENFQKQAKPQFDKPEINTFFYKDLETFNKDKEVLRLSGIQVTGSGARYFIDTAGGKPAPRALSEVQEKDLIGGTSDKKVKDKLGRQIYKFTDESNKERPVERYVISDAEIDAAGVRDNYVSPEIQYNEKCKAAEMFPVGKGNYVQIEYDKFCRPGGRSLWNVGLDGLFPSQDDVLLVPESDWRNPNLPSKYKDAVNKAESLIGGVNSQVQRTGLNGRVTIAGASYRVGASQTQKLTQTQCQDFMEPGDCDTLFLACDAVMCPPSRCNLGGKWDVPNVIQSGIIGSIVLCQPTTKTKVCLSGILASLQNIRSVLQGFNQCLKTQKVTGQSVGICDKIRSVFICELVWKEAVSLLEAKEGILSFLGSKLAGDRGGGGEYGNFEAAFKNADDSLKFFTSEYAQGSFSAFQGKSLQEVGTEICKAAVFAKYPGPGILDQVTKPESPPQFTAEFDVYPYSERTQQSRYSVFYHIYAGENPGLNNRDFIRYSVYLRNSIDSRFGFYGTTERCTGNVGLIKVGGFASFNVDCVANTGYDQVCVSIEGRTDCGFGTVTTSFGLNYANDLVVEGQVKKQIKTEKECVGTFSTGIDVGDATAEGIGFLKTGLVRKCSVERPGDNWEYVGTCGEDKIGRSLGTCWLNKNSIQIRNEETRRELLGTPEQNIPGWLGEKTGDFLVNKSGKFDKDVIIKLFGEGKDNIKGADHFVSEAEKILKENKEELINRKKEVITNYEGAIKSYEFIADSSADVELIAYAQYRLGIIYLKLVEVEQRIIKKEASPVAEKPSEEKEPEFTLRILKTRNPTEITFRDEDNPETIEAGEVFVMGPAMSLRIKQISLYDIHVSKNNEKEFKDKLQMAHKFCFKSDDDDARAFILGDDSRWRLFELELKSYARKDFANYLTWVVDEFSPSCSEDNMPSDPSQTSQYA